jgi:hypothetical protein
MKLLRDVIGTYEKGQNWFRAEVVLVLGSAMIVLIVFLLLVEF